MVDMEMWAGELPVRFVPESASSLSLGCILVAGHTIKEQGGTKTTRRRRPTVED